MDKEKLYDLIYNKADRLFKQYNPCGIHRNKKGKVVCKEGRFCCGGCNYITETGCSVKCLGCKLSFCSSDYYYCCDRLQLNILFQSKLNKLRDIAFKYDLMYIRCSKEELFSENDETILVGV